MLELQATPAGKDVIAILRRSVELKPDYVAARLQLGLLLTSQQSYSEARDQLIQIKKINPDQAPSYFLALAYSDLQTGHTDDARKNAGSAKQWAKTPAESEQADSLLRFIDASQAPAVHPAPAPVQPSTGPGVQASNASANPDTPVLKRRSAPDSQGHDTAPRNPFVKRDDQMSHVEGVAQRLDCDGESARFHVLVGRTAVVFEIPDPSKVLITHSGEAHHDFTCGAQKPFPVAVDYAVKPDPKKGTAGIVRGLDF
jgi:hypothetical protein